MNQPTMKVISKHMISIQPYVNSNVENMGMENYGMVLHEGATHKEFITCLEINNTKRYLTGLDEFAPEIESIQDKKKKEAVVKQIREKVILIERALAGNDKLSVDDKDFWSKVVLLKRENHEFWKNIFIEIGNTPIYLDEKNAQDLILISAIEARGFSEIAPSYSEVHTNTSYRWYLDKKKESSEVRVSDIKIKNKALGLLEELVNKTPKKLWLVAKCVDANSVQYKKSTPTASIYENMDNFINGRSFEKSVRKAAETFIEAVDTAEEDLRIKAYTRDAHFYRFIIHKPGEGFYFSVNDIPLGKSVDDCIEYFKNPMNAKVWESLVQEVEKYLD